ncbi:MAG: hypothetical protein AAB393_02750 [Bacteroidota bacterium]
MVRPFYLPGRKAARLVNGQLGPGTHEVTWDAKDEAAGVYVYQLKAGEYTAARKLVLIK